MREEKIGKKIIKRKKTKYIIKQKKKNIKPSTI